MNIKEKLLRFRRKLTETIEVENTYKISLENTLIDLDDKVDKFIEWYYKNMVKGHYTDIGEYHKPKDIRNFIEKIAVWYELRYPDYEVNRLMPCCGQEEIYANDIMFKNNPYITTLFDNNSNIEELEWDDLINKVVFIQLLPCEERFYLSVPRYMSIVYLNPASTNACLHLTENGHILKSEGVATFTKLIIEDRELIGLSLQDVVELFSKKGIKLPENNELEKTIINIAKWNYQREEILNCAMYRIIERGGNRIGPRRAFLFAKEFNRSIDIPMMYGVEFSDPGLRLFMNEYLKAGGSKDLECYINYFHRSSPKEKVRTISVQELILTYGNNAASFYTPEEKKLYQKLVNVIEEHVKKKMQKRKL